MTKWADAQVLRDPNTVATLSIMGLVNAGLGLANLGLTAWSCYKLHCLVRTLEKEQGAGGKGLSGAEPKGPADLETIRQERDQVIDQLVSRMQVCP
jgi:hypothetical protein